MPATVDERAHQSLRRKTFEGPCAARREGASFSCHLALLCGTSFQTLSPSALLLARFLLPLILSTILTSTRLVLLFFLSLFLSFFLLLLLLSLNIVYFFICFVLLF